MSKKNVHTYHDKNWSQWFYYDESSPTCLRWSVRPCLRLRAGHPAGNTSTASERAQVKLAGKNYAVHQIIYQLHYPGVVAEEIDHKDQNPKNNRIENLRPATPQANMQNKPKQENNTSGVTGVHKLVVRGIEYWVAQWSKQGSRKRHAKCFPTQPSGSDVAFRAACEFRQLKIQELNAAGADYTEGHGK